MILIFLQNVAAAGPQVAAQSPSLCFPGVPCWQAGSAAGATVVLYSLIGWLLSFALAVSFLFLAVGGMFFLAAGDDEGRKEMSKRVIYRSLLGIFFSVFLYAAVVIIANVLSRR